MKTESGSITMSERNSLCYAVNGIGMKEEQKTLQELWRKTLLPRHGVETPNPRERGVCSFIGLVKEVRS